MKGCMFDVLNWKIRLMMPKYIGGLLLARGQHLSVPKLQNILEASFRSSIGLEGTMDLVSYVWGLS